MTDEELRESYRRRRQQILHPSPAAEAPPRPAPAAPVLLDALSPEEINQTDTIHRIVGVDAARAVAMRLLGFTPLEIAEELHTDKAKVERWLALARKRGALSDVGDRLQFHAAAAAADKLVAMIEAGDKDAVLETLKGLGYLRSYNQQHRDGAGDAPINLQVNVELPTGVRSINDIAITGQICGAPREITDGQVQTTDGDEGENDPA